jgi:carboxyl-terminal processing protease
VARYYTPKNRSIQALGIAPDVVVADAAPARVEEARQGEKDLARHLGSDAPSQAPGPAQPPDDHQLRTAVDYLKAVDIFKASIDAPRGVAAKKKE